MKINNMSIPSIEEEQAVALENFWNDITPEQEETLADFHADNYMGTDDDMSDAFISWSENLDLDEIEEILQAKKI